MISFKEILYYSKLNTEIIGEIIIPCHRVIGKNKKLIGYAENNIDIQEKLLNFEKSNKKYINNRCCHTMKN